MRQRLPIVWILVISLLFTGAVSMHAFFSKGGRLYLSGLSSIYSSFLEKRGIYKANMYLEWDSSKGRPWVVGATDIRLKGIHVGELRLCLGWGNKGVLVRRVDMFCVDVDLAKILEGEEKKTEYAFILQTLMQTQGGIQQLSIKGGRGLMAHWGLSQSQQAGRDGGGAQCAPDAVLPKIDCYWDKGSIRIGPSFEDGMVDSRKTHKRDQNPGKAAGEIWARGKINPTPYGGSWTFSVDPFLCHIESLGIQHMGWKGSGFGSWTEQSQMVTDWSVHADMQQWGVAGIPGVILEPIVSAGHVSVGNLPALIFWPKPQNTKHSVAGATGCTLSRASIQGIFSKNKAHHVGFKVRVDGADLSGKWQEIPSKTKSAWDLSVRMDRGQIHLSKLGHIWPRIEASLGARCWVLQRFHGGSLSKGHIFLGRKMGQDGKKPIQLKGGFAIHDTALSFMPNMPPITQMVVTAVCDTRGFDLSVEKGLFEQHAVRGNVQIAMDATPSILKLDTHLTGPLETLLPMLLRLSNATDLNIRHPTGQAKTRIYGHMPLISELTMEDVTLNLHSDVPDAGFDFPIGPYWLDVRKTHIQLDYKDKKTEIQATGTAQSIPVKWSLKKEILNFSGQPTSQQIGGIFGTIWSQYVQKSPRVSGTYHNGVLDVRMDLTPCACELPWLRWKKIPGSALCAVFKKTARQMDLCLKGSGLNGHITADHGTMPDIRADVHMGKTWCAYRYAGNKRALDMTELWDIFLTSGHHQMFFRSPFINLMDLLEQASVKKIPQKMTTTLGPVMQPADSGTPVTIDLDLACEKLRMRHIEMDQVKLQLSGVAPSLFSKERNLLSHYVWRQGSFYSTHAAQNVKRPKMGLVSMLWDAVGKNKTRIIADIVDLGAAANGIGITQRIRGGNLRLEAIQDEKGVYSGSIYIDRMKTKFGALGKLLSVISPTMFTEMFSSGVMFDQLDAGFRYQPGALKIINGIGKGVNLGLFIKGYVYTQPGSFNLQGVAVPSYLINTFFSRFPVIGWFFGGKKGLISSEFSITGPLGNPKIKVVPLSLFKFGFLKSIPFFKQRKKAKKAAPLSKAKKMAPLKGGLSQRAISKGGGLKK